MTNSISSFDDYLHALDDIAAHGPRYETKREKLRTQLEGDFNRIKGEIPDRERFALEATGTVRTRFDAARSSLRDVGVDFLGQDLPKATRIEESTYRTSERALQDMDGHLEEVRLAVLALREYRRLVAVSKREQLRQEVVKVSPSRESRGSAAMLVDKATYWKRNKRTLMCVISAVTMIVISAMLAIAY